MSFCDYFDKIFVINRRSREDRWAHVLAQFTKCGFIGERFEAHEGTQLDGSFNGNFGCTASHRALLEIIAYHRWPRTLVLEDDFEVVDPGRYGDHAERRLPFEQQWSKILPHIPDEWDLLYLGGHYGSPPLGRINEHIVRVNTMLTTSSYAITADYARKMAPHICGIGPIDSLYGHFQYTGRCYCVQPRLFVQYTNVSDLQHREMENAQCMLDPNHERMV